jgi:hypothetical protein
MKLHHLELCIDVMFVCEVPFLTAIDRSIKYRSAATLVSRQAKKLFDGLEKIIRVYNNAGFLIKKIHCDIEFKPMMDKIKDELECEVNHTNAGDMSRKQSGIMKLSRKGFVLNGIDYHSEPCHEF